MLHALAHAHRKLDLIAAHVDHGLRPDSADAARRVASLAAEVGVANCQVVRVEVGRYRNRLPGWSVQQAARAARYQALASVVEQQAAAALLVAHTADDQAETLLLHLLRGSGLQGLLGMRLEDVLDPRRLGPPAPGIPAAGLALRVVRPLLRIDRATTLAYCSLAGMCVVEDPSNLGRAFTRNRVRLDLVPLLEQFNPAVRSVLARTADLVADDLAVLDALAEQLLNQLEGDAGYDLRLWRSQPRALQRRVLRLSLESRVGSLVDVSAACIEDALDLLQTGQPNQTYDLPNGVELGLGSERFVLRSYGRTGPYTPVGALRAGEFDKSWDGEGARV